MKTERKKVADSPQKSRRKPLGTFLCKDVFGNDIYMPPSTAINKFPRERDALLREIGQYVGWGDDLRRVLVTDRSRFGDFELQDSELTAIGEYLGCAVKHDDYLHKVIRRKATANVNTGNHKK